MASVRLMSRSVFSMAVSQLTFDGSSRYRLSCLISPIMSYLLSSDIDKIVDVFKNPLPTLGVEGVEVGFQIFENAIAVEQPHGLRSLQSFLMFVLLDAE